MAIVNAQANKNASKPAVTPKTKQADAKNSTAQTPNKNSTAPEKVANSAKAESIKKPVLNDAMCNNEMIQYLSSDPEPSLHNLKEVSNGTCLSGYNDKTCCNKRDFMKLEEEWHKEINNDDFDIKTYVQAIKDLTLNQIYELGRYLKSYYSQAIEDYKQKKIDEITFFKMQKIQQTDFNQGYFFKKWKMFANQCLSYMTKSVKGSLCAACDPIESRRFQRVPVKNQQGETVYAQYVFPEDLQMFAIKCNKYMYGLRVLHQLVRNIAITWNHFRKEKMRIIPKMYPVVKAKRVYAKMKKCAKDPKYCNNKDVLRWYTVAPMTKYDYFIKPYVEEMSRFLKNFFISNSSQYGNDLQEFVEKLEKTKMWGNKKKEEKSGDSDIIQKMDKENHDQYSTLRFYRQKEAIAQEYVIAPKELDLKYTLANLDESLPMPKAITDSYFLNGRNSCKLASIFGGIPIGFNRNRKGKEVCSNVKWSCCTHNTFENFRYTARLGMDRLKTYYYNRFVIDIFF